MISLSVPAQHRTLGHSSGTLGEKVAVVAVDDCDIAMGGEPNYSCAAQGQTARRKAAVPAPSAGSVLRGRRRRPALTGTLRQIIDPSGKSPPLPAPRSPTAFPDPTCGASSGELSLSNPYLFKELLSFRPPAAASEGRGEGGGGHASKKLEKEPPDGAWTPSSADESGQVGRLALLSSPLKLHIPAPGGLRLCDPAVTPRRSLDLTGPLLLGGVPDLPEDFPVRSRDFVGCMSNLTIDSEPVDMAGFIANNGTTAGFVKGGTENLCQNGGLCVNQWNTYSCSCPLTYGGKNCEQAMPSPQLFDGHALVSWSEPDVTIGVPWYLGLMFRTRQGHGTLMQVDAGDASQISLLIRDSLLCFEVALGEKALASLALPQVRVNDGRWHHVLVELKSAKDGKDIKYMALVSLDYGMFQRTVQIGNELPGRRLRSLSVGGVPGPDGSVLRGFQGCMQGVRMGETATNTANVNMQQGRRVGVEEGCGTADPCGPASCPQHSRCSDAWNAHTCVCEPGYFGKDCVDACQLTCEPCPARPLSPRLPGPH
ncbi:hypothetical protein ANANG_G00309990 [Anguilla anguilla]|uniref:EGF-like domain-containing protein n=1 Tax=Anguilla anguilla TaxID=7936 RepID=A0A9D3RJQ0_ANGAN|nr:hypothetical protein ANANG_G00309990 [Anguilla anguilla]